MKVKGLMVILAAFIVYAAINVSKARPRLDVAKARAEVQLPASRYESGTDEVSRLVQKLWSARKIDREQAKTGLLILAKQSAESREQVIRELMTVVENSDERLRLTSTAEYKGWESATTLLGELKATEAIDTLIACIACSGDTGGLSFYNYPALRALTMIGEEATPKLTLALGDARPATRKYAALALGEIGGPQALPALEQSLLIEQDVEVAQSIKIALRALKSAAESSN